MAIEQSLLTDEVRALIGKGTEPVRLTITRRQVARARELYTGVAGRWDGEDGELVPGYVMVALEPEGDGLHVPDLLPDSLLISNEWIFERPLRLGEELTIAQRLADFNERFGGQFGYSIHVRTEAELRDTTGAIVARSVRTLMQYDASEKRGGGE